MTTADPRTNSPYQYTYRPSAFGASRSFALRTDAIEWENGRRSGRIAFDRVTWLRLSFRPATMQSQRFMAEIWSTDGPKLVLASTSWKSLAEQQRLDREYREFLLELHRRLSTHPAVRFDRGTSPPIYWAGVGLFVVTAVALAWVAARAVQRNATGAALLVGGFLAAFLWQAGNYFRRNRPGRYRPEALPDEVMPRS